MRLQQLALAALTAANLSGGTPAERGVQVYSEAVEQMLRDGSPPPPLAQMLQNALADARRLEDSDLAAWQLRSTIGEVLNEQAGTRFIEVGGLPLDFSDSRAARSWRAVDDRIMGGASTSTVRFDEQVGAASFEGELVVEGGGFASVRYSPPFRIPSDVEALELEARGDGRAGYKLTLRSDAVDSSVSYQFQLPPLSGEEFTKLRLPLSEFRATSRGRSVLDAPPLRAADVRSLGLMLSRYESSGGMGKQSIPPGKFRLQIKRIAVAKSELAMNALRWVKPPPGN